MDNNFFLARVAAFEGRPSVYIWDGLRLARKKRSREMVLYYAIASIIQTVNAFVQFFVLNTLLGSPLYTFWGPSLLSDLIAGDDWQQTGHFPRIVHCDFNRRRPASVQMDTVLCVLTLNLIYEKIFIFLWFWLLFVAIMSLLNTCKWLASLCSTRRTRTLVMNYLSTAQMPSPISNEKFLRILDRDGLFVIEQISLNLGDIPASYLAISMRNIAANWDEGSDDDDIEEKEKLVA
ncbi:hypothetical protein WR25_06979 [Diploscapter pachys]|uniref:Innexin n=1 Tax=Diploscapter pachys TaxID=2018661 RepID=A0A2A2LDX5_9BILA|nr:hypothetical protein WR25_06979 [Diploscapter pachys]